MAFIFAESFDFYDALGDMTTYGPWLQATGINATPNAFTRFGAGKCLFYFPYNSGIFASKPFEQATTNTIFIALAYYVDTLTSPTTPPGAGGGATIQLRNGGTVIGSIQFDNRNGAIVFTRSTGTVLATYPNAFGAAGWNHFQFKIVLDPVNGSVALRKNGDPQDTFFAGGLNTTPGPVAVDGLSLVSGNTGTGSTAQTWCRFDDMLVFDNSGVHLNNWCGDIRAFTIYPNGDTAQKDFTSNVAGLSQTIAHNSGANVSRSSTANRGRSGLITPTQSGEVTEIGVNLSAFSGRARLYLMTDNNGNPDTLIAASTILTSGATGFVPFLFPTPVNLQKGVPVHALVVSDGALTFPGCGTDGTGRYYPEGVFTADTFTEGDRNGVSDWAIRLQVKYSYTKNYHALSEAASDGDASYVAANTVGATDLYEFDNLPTTPAYILAVQARIVTRKSDAGTRGAKMLVKSGGVVTESPELLQATSYQAILKAFPLDPATGAAWTTEAVAAMQVGVKVST